MSLILYPYLTKFGNLYLSKKFWQSRDRPCDSPHHREPNRITGSGANSLRSLAFFFRLTSCSFFIDHYHMVLPKSFYRFVDFVQRESPLSEVNSKCINGRFAFSSG